VGLVLFEPRLRVGAIAHIVLPNSDGRAPATGKFVDTAVEAMVDGLQQLGAAPTRLVAKLAGGANMFDSKGPFQIGRQNIDAAYQQLAARRIRLLAEHVGGTRGRKATFDCRTGEFLVEVLGDAPAAL
jgi:chemotaxis protein CheD